MLNVDKSRVSPSINIILKKFFKKFLNEFLRFKVILFRWEFFENFKMGGSSPFDLTDANVVMVLVIGNGSYFIIPCGWSQSTAFYHYQ